MLTKWDIFLLKCFDICGFFPEIHTFSAFRSIYKYLLHILWAIMLTVFITTYLKQPEVVDDVLPYTVNVFIQYTCGIFTYWVIIIESYTKCKTQRQFWQIYECMNHRRRAHTRPSFLSVYSLKLMEFLIVVVPVQVYFLIYFMIIVGNYFFFRLAYIYSVTVNQCRVFYYLFYLNLVKCELDSMKNDLQDMIELINTPIIQTVESIDQTIDFVGANTNVHSNRLHEIYGYYQQIHQLSDCINHIFEWSHFLTVLFCFQLLLSDGNWALLTLHEREAAMGYLYGNFT